jgi:hypothetical protein
MPVSPNSAVAAAAASTAGPTKKTKNASFAASCPKDVENIDFFIIF